MLFSCKERETLLVVLIHLNCVHVSVEVSAASGVSGVSEVSGGSAHTRSAFLIPVPN